MIRRCIDQLVRRYGSETFRRGYFRGRAKRLIADIERGRR